MQSGTALLKRHIVLGISGGVAAYKTPELVRQLRDQGAEVHVVLTKTAHEFVTPLALEAVGAHIAPSDPMHGAMPHITLARWADLVLIAPATAHILARLATGAADDLLTTLCLATEAPIAVAPAMNRVMWEKQATQTNCRTLINNGITLLGPDQGLQACGETGFGRMLETDALVAWILQFWQPKILAGLKALVTAGPTYEPLDPVRGLTNRSSGKMGYAIAQALIDGGAHVTLITGPTALATPRGVRRIDVLTARDMLAAVENERDQIDLFIGTAAVADYEPVDRREHKLKKQAETILLTLTRTPDILMTVAQWEHPPYTVGFAAETENLETHGRAKLTHKGLDLIVANPVGGSETGFGSEENIITLIDHDQTVTWPRAPKTELAYKLIAEIGRRLGRK